MPDDIRILSSPDPVLKPGHYGYLALFAEAVTVLWESRFAVARKQQQSKYTSLPQLHQDAALERAAAAATEVGQGFEKIGESSLHIDFYVLHDLLERHQYFLSQKLPVHEEAVPQEFTEDYHQAMVDAFIRATEDRLRVWWLGIKRKL